jgi:hypothetical protein
LHPTNRTVNMIINQSTTMETPLSILSKLQGILLLRDGLPALEAAYQDARSTALDALERAEPSDRVFLGLDFAVLLNQFHEGFTSEFAQLKRVCEQTAIFLEASLERVDHPLNAVPDFAFGKVDTETITKPCTFYTDELRTGFSSTRLKEALRVFRTFPTCVPTAVPHPVPDGLVLNVAWLSNRIDRSPWDPDDYWFELKGAYVFPTGIMSRTWESMWDECNRLLHDKGGPLRSLHELPTDLRWSAPVILRELRHKSGRACTTPLVVCRLSPNLVVFPTLLT